MKKKKEILEEFKEKKPCANYEKNIYIERSILRYFKERIGDKYKLEVEKNERKRNIQKDI